MTVSAPEFATTDRYVADLRNSLLDEVLLLLGIVGVPLAVLSLARIPMMGWRPVFGLQLVLLATVWLIWFRRAKISYEWRRAFALFSLGVAGLSGYVQYGPAATSGQFLLLFLVIAVLFMDGGQALRLGGMIVAGLALVAWAAVIGMLDFDFDYEVYAHSPIAWLLILVSFAGYGGGVARLAWLLFRGLTEYQQKLVQANAELAVRSTEALAATVAKSRFLATMSHEIRTPMNGILGMAQLLMMPGLKESEQRDYARTILNAGQTLLVLLNDILDLSKIESGKVVLEQVDFDPVQLIREVKSLFEDGARAKGIQIALAHTTVDGHMYSGDVYRLRQMLSNLVGNAIKFTDKGNVTIEVCESESSGNAALLEFSVTDTGVGVPESLQPLLFKPFSQADSSTTRKFGGTGLGLSIVRSLAECMGGQAGMESEVGKGARFWFRVGTERAVDAGDPVRANQQALPKNLPGNLQGRVLVAEDGPSSRDVIVAMLGRLGLSAVVVDNGKQAVDAVKHGVRIDLALMDIEMPVLDGCDAARHIREWEREQGLPHMPIIAITAHAFNESRQRVRDAGMDGFLAKPIDMTQLASLLAPWLHAQTQVPVPKIAEPRRSLDKDAIGALLVDLVPLLEQNKFSALARFGELEELVIGTAAASAVAEAAKNLKMMRFDLALEQLTRIARDHDWRMRSS